MVGGGVQRRQPHTNTNTPYFQFITKKNRLAVYHNLFKGTYVVDEKKFGAESLHSSPSRLPSTCLPPPPHTRSHPRCSFLPTTITTEGVLVAKKDFYSVWTYKSPDGDNDLSLPNLEVINLLKSLKSSGYVKETFNWCAPLGK